jgi:23S rRNA (guanosine2251-2'-O)-methyltransferase
MERLSGTHCVREALSAQRRDLLRLWVERGALRGEVLELCQRAEKLGVPVSEIDAQDLLERLDPASRRSNPQGLMLEVGPLPQVGLEELLEGRAEDERCLVILDGVEDPQNVGSLVRVAESAGAAGLILSERRAPPLGASVARASAGAIEWLPVARVPNLARALDQVRDAGIWVVGADVNADTSLFDVPDRIFSGPLAVVVGAEGRGLRPSTLERVDHPITIPMLGHVDSLNVSTASAVILYELLRRKSKRADSADIP